MGDTFFGVVCIIFDSKIELKKGKSAEFTLLQLKENLLTPERILVKSIRYLKSSLQKIF